MQPSTTGYAVERRSYPNNKMSWSLKENNPWIPPVEVLLPHMLRTLNFSETSARLAKAVERLNHTPLCGRVEERQAIPVVNLPQRSHDPCRSVLGHLE